MRKKDTVNIQTAQTDNPTGHASARSTPSVVATPLPPLNLSQIGKLWPITEKPPAMIPANGSK